MVILYKDVKRNKLVYSNYQFYETKAFMKFIEKRESMGFRFDGTLSGFSKFLKFHSDNNSLPSHYTFYWKRRDKNLDKKIEKLKENNHDIVCENRQFLICRENAAPQKIEGKNLTHTIGISLKKAIAYVAILLFISVISLILRTHFLPDDYLNHLILVLSTALIINFLVYFIADTYDYYLGHGELLEGKFHFIKRSPLKNTLFLFGDILKVVILVSSIGFTMAILLTMYTPIMMVNLIKMWLVYFIIGWGYKLRFRQSYIYLLWVTVFLLVF